MSSNRTSAPGLDAGETRIIWSIFRMTGVLRRTDNRSGKSVSTLTRAEVLGLEARLRALSSHPTPPPKAAPDHC